MMITRDDLWWMFQEQKLLDASQSHAGSIGTRFHHQNNENTWVPAKTRAKRPVSRRAYQKERQPLLCPSSGLSTTLCFPIRILNWWLRSGALAWLLLQTALKAISLPLKYTDHFARNAEFVRAPPHPHLFCIFFYLLYLPLYCAPLHVQRKLSKVGLKNI